MNTQQLATELVRKNSAPPDTSQRSDLMEGNAMRRPLRVFLVEDSAHVRDLLLDFLHEPGEVEIIGYADTEEDAVAQIIAQSPDAVIVDLKLREGGGMAVIERLRAKQLNPSPTLIVFTNHPFPEIRRRAIKLGADYFFDKSADYDSVRTTLQALRAK